jgi:hypothetical protein
MDGVIVVRPSERQAPYLEHTTALNGRKSVLGAMNAVREIFVPLDSTVSPAGGVISSIISGSDDLGDEDKIVLEAPGSTKVIDLLNQVARQSRRGWIVQTEPTQQGTRVVRIGVLHPTGGHTGVNLTGREQ